MNTSDDTLRKRVRSALSKADQILGDLDAFLETKESREFEAEIHLFVSALNSGMESEDFLNDVSLARWLPAILEYDEISFDPDVRLRRLAVSLSKIKHNRVGSSHTFVYLASLSLTIVLLLIFICSNVLPVFDKMFKEFQLKLPWLTVTVLWLSSWIGPNSHSILLAGTASFLMWLLGNRIIRRFARDRILIPYWNRFCFGGSEGLIGMSRFTHALACLLRAGAVLHEAVMIAGRASNNAVCLRYAISFSSELRSAPAHLCRAGRYFPPLLIEALKRDVNGPLTKPHDVDLLELLSKVYADRAMYRREILADFLLPIAIILFGLLVGIIVLSIFLPLMSLVTSLS